MNRAIAIDRAKKLFWSNFGPMCSRTLVRKQMPAVFLGLSESRRSYFRFWNLSSWWHLTSRVPCYFSESFMILMSIGVERILGFIDYDLKWRPKAAWKVNPQRWLSAGLGLLLEDWINETVERWFADSKIGHFLLRQDISHPISLIARGLWMIHGPLSIIADTTTHRLFEDQERGLIMIAGSFEIPGELLLPKGGNP